MHHYCAGRGWSRSICDAADRLGPVLKNLMDWLHQPTSHHKSPVPEFDFSALHIPTEISVLAIGALVVGVVLIVQQLRSKMRTPRQAEVLEAERPVIAATADGKEGSALKDEVNCAVFAPPRVALRDKFQVQAYLYLSEDSTKVWRM